MHLFLQTLYLLTVMVSTAMLMLMLLLVTPDVHYKLSRGLFRPALRPAFLQGHTGEAGAVVSEERKRFDGAASELGNSGRKEVPWDYGGNNTGDQREHAVWAAAADSTCAALRVRFARRHSLPRTALASYPGSGNTWLRYLLEGSTGLFTGSVYTDRTLAAKGFYGENESPECGCTIVVKTHGYSLMGVPVDRSVRLQDQDRFFRRALLLLRNPYSSIVSYRNFQGAGHLGIASPNAFIKEDWNAFVKAQTLIWRSYALDWLIHGRSVEIIHYEHLRESPQKELLRVLEFLRVFPDPQRLQCSMQYQEGLFRRRSLDTAYYKNRNPFTKEHHEVLESAIHDVNNALARRGLAQLPTHLYEYKRENGPFEPVRNATLTAEAVIRNNILDLVMSTTDLSINGLEVTDKIGDNQMIDFTLEIHDPNTRTQYKQVLNYKRANFELMKEELSSINYKVLMKNKNIEEWYMILKEKIVPASDHHILME
ncbi:Sulfotransferase domain [Trinorchestia longiramus]|nr:Sulfotransferase domain [Trinorchestia longiramus]